MNVVTCDDGPKHCFLSIHERNKTVQLRIEWLLLMISKWQLKYYLRIQLISVAADIHSQLPTLSRSIFRALNRL